MLDEDDHLCEQFVRILGTIFAGIVFCQAWIFVRDRLFVGFLSFSGNYQGIGMFGGEKHFDGFSFFFFLIRIVTGKHSKGKRCENSQKDRDVSFVNPSQSRAK